MEYRFHDFRTDGINEDLIASWLKSLPYRKLLNKRSTTWKQLNESMRSKIDIDTQDKDIINLFIAHPTLIKRPVLVNDNNEIIVGFNEQIYLDICR